VILPTGSFALLWEIRSALLLVRWEEKTVDSSREVKTEAIVQAAADSPRAKKGSKGVKKREWRNVIRERRKKKKKKIQARFRRRRRKKRGKKNFTLFSLFFSSCSSLLRFARALACAHIRSSGTQARSLRYGQLLGIEYRRRKKKKLQSKTCSFDCCR
jgi:hypothetical protein